MQERLNSRALAIMAVVGNQINTFEDSGLPILFPTSKCDFTSPATIFISIANIYTTAACPSAAEVYTMLAKILVLW